jgi:predicted metal-dependent peptidase
MDPIIEHAIDMIIEENPFYGAVLLQLNIQESLTLGAHAAISGKENVTLYLNPELMRELTLIQAVGVLEHELLHVILLHLTRGVNKSVNVFINKTNTISLWNLATDMAVNSLISPEKLLPDAIVPEMFGYPPNLAAEQYYATLLFDTKKIPEKQITFIDLHDEWDNIDDGTLQDIFDNPNVKRSYDLYKKVSSPHNQILLPPYPFSEKPSTREFNKNANKITDIPWQIILRNFLFKQLKFQKKISFKKRNRRFDFFPGKLSIRTTKIAIAVDTSGSIGEEEFSIFFAEIKKILQFYKTKLIIIEADDDVRKVYEINSYKEDINHIEFVGGGGTDFSPVFEYIDNHHMKIDLLIYFTDLQGIYPQKTHFSYKVLWITTPTNAGEKVPFGHIIAIK